MKPRITLMFSHGVVWFYDKQTIVGTYSPKTKVIADHRKETPKKYGDCRIGIVRDKQIIDWMN